jgi:hypothetical protein
MYIVGMLRIRNECSFPKYKPKLAWEMYDPP